jgi:hypothetical protein
VDINTIAQILLIIVGFIFCNRAIAALDRKEHWWAYWLLVFAGICAGGYEPITDWTRSVHPFSHLHGNHTEAQMLTVVGLLFAAYILRGALDIQSPIVLLALGPITGLAITAITDVDQWVREAIVLPYYLYHWWYQIPL